jgi:hypothetical protein
MKILIITNREVDDDKYWDWINSLHQAGVPINGKELKDKGEFQMTDNFGYTKVTTVYKIVK